MGMANIVASGIGPAIQGGINVDDELERAQQQQEATKQAQQTTQARQLELDQQTQLMPGDTYLKLGAQDYAKKEQDFANKMQGGIQEEKESQLQQEHASISQDASVYAFNQTMLGQGKQAADFVTKSRILNPQGTQYADAQILDAQGQPTNDPDQAATFRLQPADKNLPPHDVPYQTLANLSRMKGTQIVQGKNGEMLVQTISPAMNKGQPMVRAAYTPVEVKDARATGEKYVAKGPDNIVGTTVPSAGGGAGTSGPDLVREQKVQGIIGDGNKTIFKTLGADAFGSLSPDQQPLAMRATYLFENAVRSGKQLTPAQAIAQAKQDLPILQKRGQPIVPTGFQPTENGGATAQPSDATSNARAAFNKILGKPQPAPAAAPAASPQPVSQPASQPVSRPMPARTPAPAPAAPAASPVSVMPDANAATVPAPQAGGVAPAPTPATGSLQQVSGGGPGPFERVASAISKGISAARAAGYHPGVLPGPNGTRTEIRPGMQTAINGKRMTFQSFIKDSPNGPVWLVRDDQGGLYNYVAPTR